MSKINFSANNIESSVNKVTTYNEYLSNTGDSTKYISTKALNETISNLLESLFPVGYILTTFDDNDYSSHLGFYWEPLTNTFLYANTADSVGTTGGEAAHVLTESELAGHWHPVVGVWNGKTYKAAFYRTNVVGGESWPVPSYVSTPVDEYVPADLYGSTRGNNQPHNNMPPYTIVRMWRRVS